MAAGQTVSGSPSGKPGKTQTIKLEILLIGSIGAQGDRQNDEPGASTNSELVNCVFKKKGSRFF